jgi:16S rRNA (uracil1498-N3)-methyltransferase
VTGVPATAPGPHDAEALVFVADLDQPVLADADRHHLERVLRLRPGAALVVSDGAGRWRSARLGPVLADLGTVVAEVEPVPELAVAFGLSKGDKPELVVQKLTELGIDRIIPMSTERAVVRWDGERAVHHVERLRRVAREASAQCRRTRLPVVEVVVPFTDVAARPGACLADLGEATAEVGLGSQRPGLDHPLVLVGPEGGWSPAERAVGLPVVNLGDLVLRAETAAMAAGVLLAAARRHRSAHDDG